MRSVLAGTVLLWCCAAPAMAYSVLTHEAIIDVAWMKDIQPLLLRRFPSATPEDLRKAHAYAYGGAIIQDMGYYPFGNKLFTDLTHYVRSGDFVLNLLNEAQDLNEYAFALGSLAHFAADNRGHPEAINRAVPMMYGKLKSKFGPTITYADDPASHLKVEFAFDVIEVAQGNYAPEAYHDFIGFEVAKPVLERAFFKTYSLQMWALFRSEDLALGTYRFSVSELIPKATKAAWSAKRNEILKTRPSMAEDKFVYSLSRADYEKEWGSNYERPGILARVVALVFRIVPKIGPFKALAVRIPPDQATAMFTKSFMDTVDQYRALLAAHRRSTLKLPNENFDLGAPTQPGKYRLADNAYASLVDKLHDQPIAPELRQNILAFYSDLDAPFETKQNPKAWAKLLNQLAEIRGQGAQIAECR